MGDATSPTGHWLPDSGLICRGNINNQRTAARVLTYHRVSRSMPLDISVNQGIRQANGVNVVDRYLMMCQVFNVTSGTGVPTEPLNDDIVRLPDHADIVK